MKNTSSAHDSTVDMKQEVTLLRKQVAELTALVKYYEQQFLLLKRRQYGVSSEKTDADLRQMSLFAEAEPVVTPDEANFGHSSGFRFFLRSPARLP